MNNGGSRDWCWYLSFSDFLRPDLSPWGYRNMFSGSTVLFESKTTELGNSNQETSPSGKNSAISCMEGSMLLFPVMGVFPRFLSAICYDTSVLNESQNLLQGLVSHGFTVYLFHFNLFLPQYQITLSHSTLKNVALPMFEVFIQFCWIWIFLKSN